MNLQELASSVEFGMNFAQIDSKDLNDFEENADQGQKWWNQDEELMYYKVLDTETGDYSVFFLISGKAHLV